MVRSGRYQIQSEEKALASRAKEREARLTRGAKRALESKQPPKSDAPSVGVIDVRVNSTVNQFEVSVRRF